MDVEELRSQLDWIGDKATIADANKCVDELLAEVERLREDLRQIREIAFRPCEEEEDDDRLFDIRCWLESRSEQVERKLASKSLKEIGRDPKIYDIVTDLLHFACTTLAAEVERLQEKSSRAVALLQICYESGHRHGWEEGPTTDETCRLVNDFLSEHVPQWGDREIEEANEEVSDGR